MSRKLIMSVVLVSLIFAALIWLPTSSASYPYPTRGPEIDTLIWVKLTEPSAAVDALLTHAIDMLDLSQPGDIATVKAAGFPVVSYPYGRIVFFAPNHNRTITSDLAFRQAIAHLLDKPTLLATYVGPLGVYETNLVPNNFGEWYNPDVPDVSEYDPDLAKYLLDQAGYTVNPATGKRIDPATGTDMRTLDLAYYSDIPFRGITWAAPYAAALQSVGIPVNLAPCAFGTGEYYTKLVQANNYDIWLGGYMWAPGDPTALDLIFSSHASLPIGAYHNPAFDSLVYDALHTFNHTKAVEDTWAAEELAMEDVACIPCFSMTGNTAYNPNLVGYGIGKYFYISAAQILLYRWKDTVGGTLRIGYFDDAANMIPGFDESARADIWWGYLLDGSVDYSPYTGAMMPWIFTKWSCQAWSDPAYGVTNGMVADLNIRDDVYWQDGVKFTVDDVKFNMEYWRDKEAPRAADEVAELVKIDVVNPYEMKVYFSAVKLLIWEAYLYQMCRSPKHIYNDNTTLYGAPAGPMDLQYSGKYGVPDPSTFWPTDHTNPFNSSLTCLVGIGPWIYPPGGWDKGKSCTMIANRNYCRTPLITDINLDFTVDIIDIATGGKGFGSTSASPRWNVAADVNGDNRIDIIDIAIIAKDFGKSW